jgi:hypothetical protein
LNYDLWDLSLADELDHGRIPREVLLAPGWLLLTVQFEFRVLLFFLLHDRYHLLRLVRMSRSS